MTPDSVAVVMAELRALRREVESNHLETRDDIQNLTRVLDTHNGRLRRVEKQDIRDETRAKVEAERAERFAQYKVPVVTSVLSALVVMLVTYVVSGGPVG